MPRLAVKALFLYTYAALSALYAVAVVRRLAPGRQRCIAAAPVILSHLLAPLVLDHRTEPLLITPVAGIFSLSAFKLLAFALGRGPLVLDWLSPLQFCGVFLGPVVPIEVFTVGSQDTARRHTVKHGRQLLWDSWRSVGVGMLVTWVLAVPGIPVMARHWLYTLCSATFLNAVFDVLAAAVHGSLGISSAPSFDRPWLSSSFQDFWARRWNLTTTYMMRVLVYEPVIQGSLLPPPAAPAAVATPVAAPASPAHAAKVEGQPQQQEQEQEVTKAQQQEDREGEVGEGQQEERNAGAAAAAAPAGPAKTAAEPDGGDEGAGDGLRRRRAFGKESAQARHTMTGELGAGSTAKAHQLKDKATNGGGAHGSSSSDKDGRSGGRRPTQLRRFLALQAVFLFSGLWHILIFWYNTRVFSWKWAAFFTVQAPILMVERAVHKLGGRLGVRVPHALQVFSANFLLIVVARPLFFGPADDTGFAQRNLAVGQAPLWAAADWLGHLRAAGQQQRQ
eukprot:XP_001699836.1 predicted protein [Chlamydomonas reinhardtii]